MILRALILAVTGFVIARGADATQNFQLPNGLRVLLAENHERPLVRLELRTVWDPSEEPAGKTGLGWFLADLLKTSTPLNRAGFQRFLEDRALRFSFTMHPRSFAWSVLSDSQGQDGAFESLAAAATRQGFDGAVVEARRQSYLAAFKERTPRVVAEDHFRRRVGDPSRAMLPEEGSLSRIEFQDLIQLSRRVLRPEKSVLVIQGDLNLPQARQLAMLHLGTWGPGAQAALSAAQGPLPEPSSSTRTWVIRDAEGAIQIQLGAAQSSGKPLPASTLAICTWLVKRELAFNLPPALVKAEFRPFADGSWMIEVAAAPGKSIPEAMQAVQKLLTQLIGKGAESGDVMAARLAWNTERRTRVLHPQQAAGYLADLALTPGLLDEGADSLKVEELQTALRQLFSAEACSYFIVGATAQDAAWLAKAGFGPMAIVN
jgi:hypothetical protein